MSNELKRVGLLFGMVGVWSTCTLNVRVAELPAAEPQLAPQHERLVASNLPSGK